MCEVCCAMLSLSLTESQRGRAETEHDSQCKQHTAPHFLTSDSPPLWPLLSLDRNFLEISCSDLKFCRLSLFCFRITKSSSLAVIFNIFLLSMNVTYILKWLSRLRPVLSRIFELFEYSNSFSRILLFVFVFVPL